MFNHHHIGSSLDDFLREEGLLEECEAVAQSRIAAWQIEKPGEGRGVSRDEQNS